MQAGKILNKSCLLVSAVNRCFAARPVAALSRNFNLELEKIRKRNQFATEVIYGIQPTLAVLSAKQRSIEQIFIRDDLLSLSTDELTAKNSWLSSIVRLASTLNLPTQAAPREFMTALTNGRSNQGVAVECSPMPMPSLRGVSAESLLHFLHCPSARRRRTCCGTSSMILLLDQIQDVMNLGSILRTAVFFGIPTVLISAFFSATPSPLISKLSAGAMECLQFYRVTNTAAILKQLSNAGYIVVGTAGKQADGVANFEHSQPLELSLVEPSTVIKKNTILFFRTFK